MEGVRSEHRNAEAQPSPEGVACSIRPNWPELELALAETIENSSIISRSLPNRREGKTVQICLSLVNL